MLKAMLDGRSDFSFRSGSTTILDGDSSSSDRCSRLVSGRTFGTLDLVAAARRNNCFLISCKNQCLREKAYLVEAVRRYDQLWMPLISNLTASGTPSPDGTQSCEVAPMILPPVDVEWIWLCHTLNPGRYRDYCERKFSRLIGKQQIFGVENEDYARLLCKQLWTRAYSSESFDIETTDTLPSHSIDAVDEDLLNQVEVYFIAISKIVEDLWRPYMIEIVYLIAAQHKYMDFLKLLQRFVDYSPFVPSLDIFLMLITHQSYPTVFAEDMETCSVGMERVASICDALNRNDVEETAKLWDKAFNQPYEKAGGPMILGGPAVAKSSIYWEPSGTDFNTKYKSLRPRFLLELCAFIKLSSPAKTDQPEKVERGILRLRLLRCHKELKLDDEVCRFSADSWRKYIHLYCEFGTKGLILEIFQLGVGCHAKKKLKNTFTFSWSDFLRVPSLTLEQEINQQLTFIASVTPPAQAPYLLKCVPDKVTDDRGDMLSDYILRMHRYKPQEGRWLSRTVLDHAGKECYVVRIRVGSGFWRRGGETPSLVQWRDRITEIREGPWSYVGDSIGRAPEKIVGIARPVEAPESCLAAWNFSTGYEFLIYKPSSGRNLTYDLNCQESADSLVEILPGRKLQYGSNVGEEADEEGFVTFVRFSEDFPSGKATALINWKLLAVEFMPEEDAVLVLLVCVSILRTVSQMRKEDIGKLLIRRRQKPVTAGLRDWGSVTHHTSSPSYSSPHLQPWYLNAEKVIPSTDLDNQMRHPLLNSTKVEGSDPFYRQALLSA